MRPSAPQYSAFPTTGSRNCTLAQHFARERPPKRPRAKANRRQAHGYVSDHSADTSPWTYRIILAVLVRMGKAGGATCRRQWPCYRIPSVRLAVLVEGSQLSNHASLLGFAVVGPPPFLCLAGYFDVRFLFSCSPLPFSAWYCVSPPPELSF